jgi:hypothetical protein
VHKLSDNGKDNSRRGIESGIEGAGNIGDEYERDNAGVKLRTF